MTAPLAEIRDYVDLVAAIQARVAALGTTNGALDAVTGLPDGYVQKLLQRFPPKTLGRQSLGPLLGGLGVKLVMVVDEEQLAKVIRRLSPSKWPKKRQAGHRSGAYAGGGVRAEKVRKRRAPNPNKGDSNWGRRMAERQATLQTPEFVKRQRSMAARVRWRRVRALRRKVMRQIETGLADRG